MSIELYNQTISLCADIEKAMAISVQSDNPAEISHHISHLTPYLSNCSLLVSNAVEIFDKEKENAAIEAMENAKVYSAKQDIQKRWLEGRLSKYNALHTRAVSVEKNLRTSIEALRSLLSYNKELANLEKFGGGGR